MKRRIIGMIIVASMMAMTITGCGKTTETSVAVPETHEEETEASEVMAEASDTLVTEPEAENTYSMPDEAYGAPVVLNGDVAYYLGNYVIATLNITTGESKILWQDENTEIAQYAFSGSNGLLLGDNLYFTRSIDGSENGLYSNTKFLNKLNVQTNEVQTVATFKDEGYLTDNLYYSEGILYTDMNGKSDCYEIDDEGNVVKTLNRSEFEEFAIMPEGYTLVTYESGMRTLFPKQTYKQNGKLILINPQFDQVMYDPSTKRDTAFGGGLLGMNDKNYLIYAYDAGSYTYGLINKKTGEYKYLSKSANYYSSIGMDEDYMYYCTADKDTTATVIGRVSLTDGKNNVIYTAPVSESGLEVTPAYLGRNVKIGAYVFTIETHDCGIYLAAINLENNEMIVGDTPYLKSGIADIGKLVRTSYTERAEDGTVLVTAKTAILNVDEKFPGADKINEIMNARAEQLSEEAKKSVPEVMSYYEEAMSSAEEGDTDIYFPTYSFSEQVDDIDYLKDNILCFRVLGYVYYGGAHGMSYQEAFIFDTETGDRINLDRFINVSEEELKDIVTAAVNKRMQEDGRDLFWEDADKTVHDIVSMDYTNAYLSDEGIVFYFEPYLIASYAQGFIDVTIPYEVLMRSDDTKQE